MAAALRTFRFAGLQAARNFTTSAARHDLAKVTLVGRLAATPEPTQTSTGLTIYRYGIGVSHGPRDNRETSWYNVSAFVDAGQEDAPRTQLLAGLDKGTLVYVEADSKMVTLPGATPDDRGRKVLNLTQRNIQILSRPAARDTQADGAFTEAAAGGQ